MIKKIIFTLFLILFIGCSSTVTPQAQFESKRNEFYINYINASNEIIEDEIWNETNSWTKFFAEECNWEIQDWHGTIIGHKVSWDGQKLALSIESEYYEIKLEYETWNNVFSDSSDETMLIKGTYMWDKASNLSIGDNVYFSAKFIKDETKGIKETSWTQRGSLENPEIIVYFTDIRKAD